MVPLKFYNGDGIEKKTRMLLLPERQMFDDMSIRRHWSDRQTDRQTELVKQYRALHAHGQADAQQSHRKVTLHLIAQKSPVNGFLTPNLPCGVDWMT